MSLETRKEGYSKRVYKTLINDLKVHANISQFKAFCDNPFAIMMEYFVFDLAFTSSTLTSSILYLTPTFYA